ncbi:MAG: ACT domain-containing protein [Clostridia bacterium]|nr:ACT domain-containing protein [Clostridia bacterium]
MVKAIVTVVGIDRTGIIARVSTLLYENNVNILDISQTVMSEYFTMVMLCDVGSSSVSFSELKKQLEQLGSEMALSIRIQHEEIFDAMHAVN